jgi:hypothetical protein
VLTTRKGIPKGKRYRYWRHDLISKLPLEADGEEEDRKSEIVIAEDVTLDEFLKFRLNEEVIKRYHAHYRLIDGKVIIYQGICKRTRYPKWGVTHHLGYEQQISF